MGKGVSKKMSFKITGGKGFHFKFPNGVTVSVQFGAGNYCEHYDDDMMDWIESKGKGTIESHDAEVAIWKEGGEWITWEYTGDEDQQVIGYQTFEEVLEILKWAEEYLV